MLFSLGQPIALVGLVVAFLTGVALRAAAQHLVLRHSPAHRVGGAARRVALVTPRRDVDVFGVVSALIGGTGWGRGLDDVGVGPPPRRVLLAGPVAVLVASQLAFAGFRIAGGDRLGLQLYGTADVLRGAPGDALTQLLLSLAVGLLAFGVFALIPLPPLDGWGLLRHAVRHPGPGFAKARHWLEEQNIGVVILLAGMILPVAGNTPLFLYLLDVVTTPVLRVWS